MKKNFKKAVNGRSHIIVAIVTLIFISSVVLFGLSSNFTSPIQSPGKSSLTMNVQSAVKDNNSSHYQNDTLFDGLVTPTVFSSLNYFSPVEEYYIVSLLYQPFATYLYPPGNALQGVLGQSWSHNANYTVWNLTLRNGLKWDNGSPLNSTDLWFSLMVYNQLGFFAAYSIKNISIINSTTVQVSSYLPQPNFVAVWAMDTGSIIVPYQSFHQYDTNLTSTNYTKLSSFPNFKNIVADGPFVITNYTPGENPILFTANPYFYRGSPEMGKLSIRLFSDESSYSDALRSGEIDEMWDIGPYNTVISPLYSNISGTTIYKSVPAAYESVEFNLHQWPYNTTQYRMALAYLTNRSSINSIINDADNSSLVGYDLLPSSLARSIGINPSSVNNYTYNPSKAAQLLKQIGIVKDNISGSSNYGLYVYTNPNLPNYNQPVSINIITTALGAGDVSTSVELKDQWTQAGFTVTISTLSSSAFYSTIDTGKGWAVAVQLLDVIAPTATATISATEISQYSNATESNYNSSFGMQNFNFSYLSNLSIKSFEYPFGSSSSNRITTEIADYLAEVVPTIPLWATYNWVVVSNSFYWGNLSNHTGLFSTQTLSMEPLWSGTLFVVHPLPVVSPSTPSVLVYIVIGVIITAVVIGIISYAIVSRRRKIDEKE